MVQEGCLSDIVQLSYMAWGASERPGRASKDASRATDAYVDVRMNKTSVWTEIPPCVLQVIVPLEAQERKNQTGKIPIYTVIIPI